MNKEEARKMMLECPVEEITETKYYDGEENNSTIFMDCSDGYLYFKQREERPKVFKGEYKYFQVDERGCLSIYDFGGKYRDTIGGSLNKLSEAVDYAKKLKDSQES